MDQAWVENPMPKTFLETSNGASCGRRSNSTRKIYSDNQGQLYSTHDALSGDLPQR
jgi:hypothetical protein